MQLVKYKNNRVGSGDAQADVLERLSLKLLK